MVDKPEELIHGDVDKLKKRVKELERLVEKHEQMEEALLSSKEKYRSLMYNLPGTVARINTEGKFLFVNQHFLRLAGLTPEEIIGHGPEVIERFYEPELYQRMVTGVMRSMAEQAKVETELCITDIQGIEHCLLQTAYPWYTENGDLGGIEILTHDITARKKAERELAKQHEQLESTIEQRTEELKKANLLLKKEIGERKQAEQAIRESEEKFRILAEKSPNMIFINKRGKVVYVNDKCEEVLGYTKETFFAPDFEFYTIIAPEYHEVIAKNYRLHLKGKDVRPYEYVLLTKSGERINVIITTKLITFEGELSILGIVTDITELRHLEQDLANLEIQQRMEIGHDLHDGLGQYLTGISLKCKALEHMLEEGSQIQKNDIAEVTDLINLATQKAHDLSEGLAPSSLKIGGIETALRELAQRTSSLFEISCELKCSYDIKNLDQITATHLYRIAQEAVTNAVRHGKSQRITISLIQKRNKIVMKIQNDGIRISQKKLKKGGMGLRIMKYRAQTIGAILEIKPGSKKGTTVRCTLHEKQMNTK